MKILGGVRGNTADAYFRVAAPFSVLRYSTDHEFEIRQPALGDAEEFDVLWLQRHCEPMAEIIAREFQAIGKPVVYDVDDWLFGMPPSWSCFPNYVSRGQGTPTVHLIFHERLMRMADVVTCPTEYLRGKIVGKLRSEPDGNTYVPGWDKEPNVVVLPNCILQADWDTLLPLDDADLPRPRVGWFGMEYHWDNWRDINHAVEEALRAIDGYLLIMGFPEVIRCFSDWLAGRTFVQPAVSWGNFQTMRRMVKTFDVGLAWVSDTDFNRCKSPLKAFQYGAAGVPVVAGRTVYGDLLGWYEDSDFDTIIHNYGITVGNIEALNYAIQMAVNHKERSMKHVEAWQKEVWRSHSYETQAERWLEVIESCQ